MDDCCGYENYRIRVPRGEGFYAYPYVAKFVGVCDEMGVVRAFMPRPEKVCCYKEHREFRTDFPGNGVYEIGKKAWDAETSACIWSVRDYVLVQNGDIFPLDMKEAFSIAYSWCAMYMVDIGEYPIL